MNPNGRIYKSPGRQPGLIVIPRFYFLSVYVQQKEHLLQCTVTVLL